VAGSPLCGSSVDWRAACPAAVPRRMSVSTAAPSPAMRMSLKPRNRRPAAAPAATGTPLVIIRTVRSPSNGPTPPGDEADAGDHEAQCQHECGGDEAHLSLSDCMQGEVEQQIREENGDGIEQEHGDDHAHVQQFDECGADGPHL
jgi:hypothetical protein